MMALAPLTLATLDSLQQLLSHMASSLPVPTVLAFLEALAEEGENLLPYGPGVEWVSWVRKSEMAFGCLGLVPNKPRCDCSSFVSHV
jgi:hypothetical protein